MAMELYGDDKMHYMLEIERNSSLKKNWLSWGVDFKGLGDQKDTLDSLLAKTMC